MRRSNRKVSGAGELSAFAQIESHSAELAGSLSRSAVSGCWVETRILSALKLGYYACMSSPLQVRDVPDEARRVLKARAASRGQSLNAYMLEVIDREVARPSVAEVLERAARRAERATGSALDGLYATRAEREEQLTGRAGA